MGIENNALEKSSQSFYDSEEGECEDLDDKSDEESMQTVVYETPKNMDNRADGLVINEEEVDGPNNGPDVFSSIVGPNTIQVNKH